MRQQVEELRAEFLPDPFPTAGTDIGDPSVQWHTKAFVVFGHAEVEAYLEDRAKAIVKAAEAVWLKSAKFTPPLVFMLCCFGERLVPPKVSTGPKAQDIPAQLSDRALKLFLHYHQQIKDNHGVKEKNVLELFSPLGLPLSVLGSTLLPDLDFFGAIRGTHAHQSAKAVVSVPDPETEYKRVKHLLQELIALDEWLTQCSRRIR